MLQPNEEGKVEVYLDTRRFLGKKTRRLFFILEADNKKTTEARFCLTADAQELPPEMNAENEGPKKPSEKIDQMFPDGLEHDFGKVERGEQLKYAFRIVNISSAPLRIM